MPDKSNIAIIGYSGHSFVVLDAAKLMGLHTNFYCEKEQAPNNPFDLQYLGDEGSDAFNWNIADAYILGIGDNAIRQKVAQLILQKNKKLLNIIHPASVLSNYTKFGVGNFIGANVAINAFVQIANNCIINTASIIEHECSIENGVHIGPGAVLAGNVTVGENSFVGGNSFIKQGTSIGRNVIIGAGSVVLKDIPENEIWVGNPAQKLIK